MTPRTDRRHKRRRSNDRLWDFIQRGALGLLVVLYLIGFISTGDETDAASKAAADADRAAMSAKHAADINRELIDAIDLESETRERQFCGLVLGVHRDRVTRLKSTRAYFRTAAGRERTSLNVYIRAISLPQLVREVRKERARLPDVCVKP